MAPLRLCWSPRGATRYLVFVPELVSALLNLSQTSVMVKTNKTVQATVMEILKPKKKNQFNVVVFIVVVVVFIVVVVDVVSVARHSAIN